MNKRVFIIHGWEGTPDSHWKPWLKEELERKGFEVTNPQMPNPIFPELKEWITYLQDIVGEPNTDTYFVGHSLGGIAIVRYLESLNEGQKVGGCVFIAGFSEDIGYSEIGEFYSTSENIDNAKKHCDKFVAIYSDNDKDVPIKIAKNFAQALGAEEIFEPSKGHFTSDDGVTELPSALDAILKMSA